MHIIKFQCSGEGNKILANIKYGKKENEILEVMQKGYTYKDKVIRPAMVKVNN